MKKILISLSVITVVAAIAVGGTIAYFSDTETSTGNTFTAGAIDLTIDNESYVTDHNGVLVFNQGTSWVFDDLTNEVFFDFSDLKPGDIGEDTISLHVDSNDAWACMNIAITSTPENGETEPESEVDDQGAKGELQDELYFAFWADDGDNVYEEGEAIFEEGLAANLFDGVNIILADSTSNVWDQGPLQGGEDAAPYVYYIGKVWCYGALTEVAVPQGEDSSPLVRGTGFDCDGSSVTNVSQTDGITANVTFYAEQSRNNSNFKCVQPEIIQVDSSPLSFSSTGAGGWSCPTGHPTVVGYTLSTEGQPIAAQGVFKQGTSVGIYTWPNAVGYTYQSGEEGVVVVNGGVGQTITIHLSCQAL
ncbi:M73 family metallopeptidase [Patescibacteria group bacterium]|nr:M73 family metallopeptidase [Patescibacteria group bacterium]MBU1876818.1 M73 family metallopeptidase [Patescibacteria group bacterium]